MTVHIDVDNAAKGVLGLVITLTEVIKEALEIQAVRRMESGGLSDEEIERLGQALADVDEAVQRLKRDLGVEETVQAVRRGLDDLVEELLQGVLTPTAEVLSRGGIFCGSA